MNENNQPQSQQTDYSGYYGCSKCHGTGKYYYGDTGTYRTDVEIVQPAFTEDVCDKCWGSGDEKNPDKDLNQASSESSHSPTEQPGDAKHTATPWIPWETPMIHQGKYFQCPVESAHPDGGIINVAMAFGVTREECKANAELIARAPALLSEVSTLRSKQAELVEANTKMKQFIENFIDHTSSGYDGDALIWALRTEAALTKTPKP